MNDTSKTHAILVTGASSGIGYALTEYLAQCGYKLIAVARREGRLLQLSSENKNIIPVVADISGAEGRQKVVAAVKQINQPVHLIHNAAVAGLGLLKDLEEMSLRQTVETNFFAPVLLTQMLQTFFHKSRLLNISSGLAHYAIPGAAAYCMSKAGLFMFYQCINVDFSPEILIAGSLAPGVVNTEMQQELRSSSKEKFPEQERFQKLYDQHQLLSPEKVSKFIAHVLLNTSDEEFAKKEWRMEG
ncbi:MAG: NAD(P)-dependent dehydrogenase, short-chain alcohol dehydrogenase family [Gammaproteobacteria bacterium]|jgi:short-subunit dehydrogenase|nr:NAD(P)-dependent dehydrogenase, short-chain alcohol dehydrogenase family [Gammaproteobacteria bacterium]